MTTHTRYENIDVRALGDQPEAFIGRRVALEGVLATFYQSEDGPLVELHVSLGSNAWAGTERIAVLYADNPAGLQAGSQVRVSGEVVGSRPVIHGYACGYSLQAVLRADCFEPLETFSHPVKSGQG